MLSYHPASHPRSPEWTRAATPGVDGWVRSTTKCASPSAPSTTTRDTRKGSAASRSDSGTRSHARWVDRHAPRPGSVEAAAPPELSPPGPSGARSGRPGAGGAGGADDGAGVSVTSVVLAVTATGSPTSATAQGPVAYSVRFMGS